MRLSRGVWCGLLALAMTSLNPAWATDYSGSYDVGGGAQHFLTLVAAADSLAAGTMTGPCTLNVHIGTYTGQVNIPAITGLGAANPLVIQNALGQTPVIENPDGQYGILISGADHVTVRELEVRNCGYSCISILGSVVDSATHITLEQTYLHDAARSWYYAVLRMEMTSDCEIRGNRIESLGSPRAIEAILVRDSDRNRFVNNMIAQQTTCVNAYGVVVQRGCDLHEWYFNSVCGVDAQACFYESPDPPPCLHRNTFRNNIYYNGGMSSGWKTGFYVNAPFEWLADIVSDYNLVFVMNKDSAEFGVAGRFMTLQAWRDTSGDDIHSRRFNVGLTSTVPPFDLHVIAGLPSIVDSAGVPVAGITEDFDGQARNFTHPDVGADEVTVPYSPIVLGFWPVQPDPGSEWEFFEYRVDYLHRGGLPPTLARLYVDNAFYSDLTDPGGNHAEGVTLAAEVMLTVGGHTYHFEVAEGSNTARLPAAGEFPGPTVYSGLIGTYDVGGGTPMDFATLVEAAQVLRVAGMSGGVTMNVYNGTYTGEVTLSDTISGLGNFALVFQNEVGHSPVVRNPGGYGFRIAAADCVTVRGFNITDCSTGIYAHWIVISQWPEILDWAEHNRFEGNYIHLDSTANNGIQLYHATDTYIVGNRIEGASRGLSISSCGVDIKIYNNMIYGSRYYGGLDVGNQGTEWIYNSIYRTGTSGACIFFSGAGWVRSLKNCVLYAAGASYCMMATLQFTSLPDESDYNCFYAPDSGGCLFTNMDGMEYYPIPPHFCTLAEWQNGTGRDMHSVSGDPGFVSSTDLHINPTNGALESRGIDVTWIADDIDGDGRREIPDIGADEYDWTPVPSPVTDLTAYRVGDNIQLHWTATAHARSYRVYGATNTAFTDEVQLGITAQTTFLHPATSARYFYRVVASDQEP